MYSENQTQAIGLMNQILNYVESVGVPRSDWNLGITDDRDRRLFGEHRVDPKLDRYIVLPVSNERTAKLLEKFLTDDVLGGFDGAPGGDSHGRYIYAYLKRPHTRP